MTIWNYPQLKSLTEPAAKGLYRIDHEPYHDGAGISSSDVKNALISYGYYVHKKDAESESTPALEFGRAFHMAILEPELFSSRYVVMPEFVGMTKDGRPSNQSADARAKKADWLAEAEANNQDIITEENQTLLNTLAANVRAHPRWAALTNLQPEIMACYTCPDSGLFLKCKSDLFGPALVDFKTTICAHPAEFNKAATRYGYHISAAFYQDIVAAVTGERPPFLHVVVEKKPPYGVAFYSMSDDYLEEGRKLYKAALRRIVKWDGLPLEKKQFHYGTSIHVLRPLTATLYKTRDLIEAIEAET